MTPESGSLYTGDLVAAEVGPSEGEDWLYDPPEDPTDPTDPFASVNAYFHVSQARSYFEGVTGEDMGTDEWSLVVLANYQDEVYWGGPVKKAFHTDLSSWGTGSVYGAYHLLALGQGTDVDYGLDSDVVTHEVGHYVSSVAVGYNMGQLWFSDYGLHPWGGAIDEGISDYFAVSLFDDPVMGEFAAMDEAGLRDVSETDLRCPEDIVGEVHNDGKLIGALGWSLREAYGADAADAIMWDATTLLTSDATLVDFAEGATQIATELYNDGVIDSLDPLEAAVTAGGLDSCSVVQELGDEWLEMRI